MVFPVALSSRSSVELVRCPVEYTSLTEAVSLDACAHKINERAARRIFGAMNEGSCSRPGPCPICRKLVTSYLPDYLFRQIVEKLLETSHYLGSNSPLSVTSPTTPLQSCFQMTQGDWNTVFLTSKTLVPTLCRKMNFRFRDGIIESFDLCGYNDGSIHMVVALKDKNLGKVFVESLENTGFKHDPRFEKAFEIMDDVRSTKSPNHEILFRHLTLNCKMLPKHLALIWGVIAQQEEIGM